jgi:hypothetical protein
MTDPRIHEMLAEPLEKDFGMPLTEVEQEILRAMTVGGAVLPLIATRYRELAARRRDGGTGEELRREALDSAGTLGAILRIARAHQAEIVLLDRTELKSGRMFMTLEQLYDSLVLLTDPDFDEEADVSLTGEDLDALLAIPEVQEYVNPQI